MTRLILLLKGFTSGALGMLCGYLLGSCLGAIFNVVPFIRVGSFESQRNVLNR